MTLCPGASPTVAEIDCRAFAHNVRLLRSRLAPGCHLMAVLKANAYGHGASTLAAIAVREGATWLGVARCQEGVALRQEGITAPILVLGPLWCEDIDVLLTYRLQPVIHACEDVRRLHQETRQRGCRSPVHVNIDTGMGRLGVLAADCVQLARDLAARPDLQVEGLMTHLATADTSDTAAVHVQLERFAGAVRTLAIQGVTPSYCHVANSAALYRYPQSHYTMVRPGIALYGSHPFEAVEAAALQPVLTWKTRLARVQAVPAGSGVSYGHTFVTRRPSVIGTLPVGYADGFCRGLSNTGEVLVRGRRVPIVGRICMDMATIDLTDLPQACVGDEVILIGIQGTECITVDEMAQCCGRIPYEILCAIGPRVPRHYV
jgi:alanine racemase